jgi:hypothetical protein
MTALAIALYLVCLTRVVPLRVRLIAIVPFLVLDCIGCLAVGGSIRNTMSGEAGNQPDKPWARFIDALFGKDHCRLQAERERRFGGVWPAWWASFRPAASAGAPVSGETS